ncbi:beta 1,4 glucosyltransferase [Paenibacillus montaniterrae]|uniref:Beta 1,4 glucosyltransferase n=2 Tax=Paenibacillus montaniterrae TaxID=429341 RepID=A0A919YSH3_9BACL|nr:glycosyltransferase [Paenibacillus montaniterrae]GIP17374.1 beta 1,4 glucosyltransferase [Paenibacillus montaniterrae]
MITISLCMIVRDEEETLERVLASVAGIADEINIVDTGSIDRTREIACRFTDRVFDYPWHDHFADARNFSFFQATQDYILWLDADDVIEEEDRQRFIALKQSLNPSIDHVIMPYKVGFDEAGKPTVVLRRTRLVRRDRHFLWEGAVHEDLAVYGTCLESDVCIIHRKQKPNTDRNLQIYRKLQEKGEKFSVRDLFYFANELKDHQLDEEAVKEYKRMLDTGQGWKEDNIRACLNMAECYARLGDREKRFAALAHALMYEKPQPELACALGGFFWDEQQYDSAIFWYTVAIEGSQSEAMAVWNEAIGTWFPHLQLCLCYSRLERYEEAFRHNELALRYHPTHPSLLYNRQYFWKVHQLGEGDDEFGTEA